MFTHLLGGVDKKEIPSIHVLHLAHFGSRWRDGLSFVDARLRRTLYLTTRIYLSIKTIVKCQEEVKVAVVLALVASAAAVAAAAVS